MEQVVVLVYHHTIFIITIIWLRSIVKAVERISGICISNENTTITMYSIIQVRF